MCIYARFPFFFFLNFLTFIDFERGVEEKVGYPPLLEKKAYTYPVTPWKGWSMLIADPRQWSSQTDEPLEQLDEDLFPRGGYTVFRIGTPPDTYIRGSQSPPLADPDTVYYIILHSFRLAHPFWSSPPDSAGFAFIEPAERATVLSPLFFIAIIFPFSLSSRWRVLSVENGEWILTLR